MTNQFIIEGRLMRPTNRRDPSLFISFSTERDTRSDKQILQINWHSFRALKPVSVLLACQPPCPTTWTTQVWSEWDIFCCYKCLGYGNVHLQFLNASLASWHFSKKSITWKKKKKKKKIIVFKTYLCDIHVQYKLLISKQTNKAYYHILFTRDPVVLGVLPHMPPVPFDKIPIPIPNTRKSFHSVLVAHL